MLKNAINQLEKRTTKFNIVKVFLESLYNLAKEDDPVKQKNTLISIRNKVEKSNQPEDKTFEYFDILSWLESKIQKREMAEILMENKRK